MAVREQDKRVPGKGRAEDGHDLGGGECHGPTHQWSVQNEAWSKSAQFGPCSRILWASLVHRTF